MDELNQIQIIAFYEFKDIPSVATLDEIKADLRKALIEFDVRGTIIIADEGYNGMVCGKPERIGEFVAHIEGILKTKLVFKSSFSPNSTVSQDRRQDQA